MYKISDSTKREKTPSENIPFYRKPVDIKVHLYPGRIEAEMLGKVFSEEIEAVESEKKRDFEETLRRLFSESGTSPYTLGTLIYENNTDLGYPSCSLLFSKISEEKSILHSRSLFSRQEKSTGPVKRRSLSLFLKDLSL